MSLRGKTLVVSGGSRGIGLAIALRAAKDGANIVIAAKTAKPHPKLPGTIRTAKADIEAAGGQAVAVAVAVVCDIRDERQVQAAVRQSARHVLVFEAEAALPPEGGQPAHPQPVPAARPRSQMVRPAPRLHHREIRDEPVHARHGRGVPAAGGRGELALAVDGDRRRGGALRALRRGHAPGQPHARHHGRCCLRHPGPPRPGTHRPGTHRPVNAPAGSSSTRRCCARSGAPTSRPMRRTRKAARLPLTSSCRMPSSPDRRHGCGASPPDLAQDSRPAAG